MRLTPDEQAMLDGRDGAAVQRAMDLLMRYGDALGAERLIDTRNVCGTISATTPFMRQFAARKGGMDAVFSEFNLDSDDVVEVPGVSMSNFLRTAKTAVDGEAPKLRTWVAMSGVTPVP